MALNPSNSSSLEQLALKGLNPKSRGTSRRFSVTARASCYGYRRCCCGWYSTSGCRVCSRRVIRHWNRKRIRRKCHGVLWAGRRHHSQLPARRTRQAPVFCYRQTSTIALMAEVYTSCLSVVVYCYPERHRSGEAEYCDRSCPSVCVCVCVCPSVLTIS